MEEKFGDIPGLHLIAEDGFWIGRVWAGADSSSIGGGGVSSTGKTGSVEAVQQVADQAGFGFGVGDTGVDPSPMSAGWGSDYSPGGQQVVTIWGQSGMAFGWAVSPVGTPGAQHATAQFATDVDKTPGPNRQGSAGNSKTYVRWHCADSRLQQVKDYWKRI